MKQQIIIQIVAGVFTIFALSRVYLRFKERKLSSFAFIFWIVLWILGVGVVFFPNFSTEVAGAVGIGRGADIVIYASIAVIFYLIFRILIRIEDVSREITEIARKIALSGVKESKNYSKLASKKAAKRE